MGALYVLAQAAVAMGKTPEARDQTMYGIERAACGQGLPCAPPAGLEPTTAVLAGC